MPYALLLALSLAACAVAQPVPVESTDTSPIPESSRQMLAVTTGDWSATDGTMQRYERIAEGPWRPVGEAVDIVTGRSGLGWGIGLHDRASVPDGPTKAEGDGRAPAGVFRLSAAFGYAESEETGLPYVATPGLHCVDDRASASYNQVRDVPADRDWDSHETMRRRDAIYRIGVIVAHNGPGVSSSLLPDGAAISDTAPTPGAGSCIFLHVWRGSTIPTIGCTAMRDGALSETLAWLDADADPVLVQLPASVADAVREDWGLPN